MRKLNQDPEQVTKAREAAGLTKTKLAEKVGCSLSLISEIESGTRNANPDRLARIAKATRVTVRELSAKEAAA